MCVLKESLQYRIHELNTQHIADRRIFGLQKFNSSQFIKKMRWTRSFLRTFSQQMSMILVLFCPQGIEPCFYRLNSSCVQGLVLTTLPSRQSLLVSFRVWFALVPSCLVILFLQVLIPIKRKFYRCGKLQNGVRID